MKKIFFAAFAAVALTACVADVVTEEPTYAIEFASSAKGTIKSTVITTNNLPSFQVFAFDGNGNVIMDTENNKGMKVTQGKNESGVYNGTWSYSPNRYWPANTDVDFYGVYADIPSTNDIVFNYSAAPDTGLEFTLRMPRLTSEGKFVVDASRVPDAVYAAAMNREQKDGAVNMIFRHAMAQVDFKIKNATAPADNVTIEWGGVYVNDLLCDGTYTINGETTDDKTTSPTGDWDLTNPDKVNYFFGANATALVEEEAVTFVSAGKTTGSILETNCLVFPQTTGNSEVDFKVKCTIKQNGVVIFNDYKTAKVKVDWQQGHKYTYTFVLEDGYLTNNLIKISAAVVDYKDADDTKQPTKDIQ